MADQKRLQKEQGDLKGGLDHDKSYRNMLFCLSIVTLIAWGIFFFTFIENVVQQDLPSRDWNGPVLIWMVVGGAFAYRSWRDLFNDTWRHFYSWSKSWWMLLLWVVPAGASAWITSFAYQQFVNAFRWSIFFAPVLFVIAYSVLYSIGIVCVKLFIFHEVSDDV